MPIAAEKETILLRRMTSSKLNNLGILLHQQGNNDELALEMYEEAIQLLTTDINKLGPYRDVIIRNAKDKMALAKERLVSSTGTSTPCTSDASSWEHFNMQERKPQTRLFTNPLKESNSSSDSLANDKHRLSLVIYNMSLLYCRKDDIYTAEQLLDLALQTIPEESSGLSSFRNVVRSALNNIGHIAYCLGNYQEAAHYFSKALQFSKEVSGGRNEDAIISSDECDAAESFIMTNHAVALLAIGEEHEEIGMLDEAMSVYIPLLEARQQRRFQKTTDAYESLVYAIVMRKMGHIYCCRGEINMAIKSLKFSILLRKEASMGNDNSKQHADVAFLLEDFGIILLEADRIKSAMECFQECLKLRRAVFGNYHEEVANVLYYIGGIHQDAGRYQDAINVYSEVLCIERIVLGPEHPETSITLRRLGQVYCKQERYHQALEAYQGAFAVLRKSDEDENAASVAEILEDIGAIYLKQGNEVEAQAAFAEARRLEQAAAEHLRVVVSAQGDEINLGVHQMITVPEAAAAA